MTTVITPTWSIQRYLENFEQTIRRAPGVNFIVVGSGPGVFDFDENTLPNNVWPVYEPKALLPVEAMARGYDHAVRLDAAEGIIGFIHDDVKILEGGWEDIVTQAFGVGVGLVGFGGRTGFGSDDIYKRPYALQQLIGINFLSAMNNWKDHGGQLKGPRRVAYLDGFSLFFTAESYRAIGGWEACLEDRLPFHMYDAWASAQMARHGYEVWAVPVRCHHYGGQTSVTDSERYEQAVKDRGYVNGQHLFDEAHRIIYDAFRDVLPIRA